MSYLITFVRLKLSFASVINHRHLAIKRKGKGQAIKTNYMFYKPNFLAIRLSYITWYYLHSMAPIVSPPIKSEINPVA